MKQVYILSIIIWILVGIMIPTNSMFASTNIDANVMSIQVPLQNSAYQKSLNHSYKTKEMNYEYGISKVNRGYTIPIITVVDRKRTWFNNGVYASDYLMNTGSKYSSNISSDIDNNSTVSRPRRVNENEHDSDPFLGEPVPIGDVSIFMLIFVSLLYVSLKRIHTNNI